MTRTLATILIAGQIAADLAFVTYIWLNQHWANKMTETVERLMSGGMG